MPSALNDPSISPDHPAIKNYQMVGEFRAQAARAESEQVSKALADPRFVSYKEREAAITQEALTMPEGPPRDAFLRKRLEEARIEAYRPTPIPHQRF